VIGTNKKCAQETVDLFWEDLQVGKLPEPTTTPNQLLDRLEQRGVEVVDYAGWELIDAHEKSLGEPNGRPRVKLVRRAEHLLHATASKVRS
jgi:ferredoxin--NADP+ reductase